MSSPGRTRGRDAPESVATDVGGQSPAPECVPSRATGGILVTRLDYRRRGARPKGLRVLDVPSMGPNAPLYVRPSPSWGPNRGLGIPALAVVALVLISPLIVALTAHGTLWLTRPLILSSPLRKADAIVILGAGSHDDLTPLPDTAYALIIGVHLFKTGYAPVIVLSGSSHSGTRLADADVMASLAVTFGIPPTSLILNRRATSISAQAASFADVARRHRLASMILVTSPLTSRRATWAFHRAGIAEVVTAPGMSPSTVLLAQDHLFGRLTTVLRALYEYAAIAYYWWSGVI